MVIPSSGMRDGTVKSRAGPLLDRVWAVLACTDPNGNNRPDWRFLDLTGTPEKIRRVQAFPAGFHGGSLLFWIAKGPL
ncbi:hypothetical protein CDL15_Pgr004509 [Punica granatum]|uniref:Uncharacterized protein n=1 Tax=Punica granatum TaxID=22663 RepID=A0A218WY56_PUNGR|nr:hypothetical protein CDL15_Pgr004509 [Punica granatum]